MSDNSVIDQIKTLLPSVAADSKVWVQIAIIIDKLVADQSREAYKDGYDTGIEVANSDWP